MGRSTLVQFTNPENFPLPIGPRYVQPNETVWVPWEQIPPEFRSSTPPADGPGDAPTSVVYSFTAATVPSAAKYLEKYGSRQALINGAVWTSDGVSTAAFPVGWIRSGIYKPPSVSALGHSLTAQGQPLINSFSNVTWNQATYLANAVAASARWQHTIRSYIARGAMRSRGAWKMHYFTCAIGGANSQFIYENALPTLFLIDPNVPDPNMCVIFTAGNDAPVTGSANFVPATTYNRLMAETLLNRGITPIFVADPPRINAGNQTEMCRYFEKWAMISQDLAKEYGCPWVNAYGATVNAANGQPLTGVTIADGTHLTAFGAELVGWALNEAIREHITPSNLATRVFPFWSDTTLTYRSENPAFMDALAAGTINTAGSRPGGWSAPGVTTQGTVFDVANTPTPKPQIQTSPQIGTRTEPAYQGYAFQLAGDGVNSPVSTKQAVAATQGVAAVAGDKMAVSFRIKWVPDPAVVTQTGDIDVIARSAGQQAAGLVITQTVNQNDDTYQIGGTTDYPAGDFYQEFIARGAGPYYESLWLTRRTGGASNANDRLTIANMSIINLTAAGLA